MLSFDTHTIIKGLVAEGITESAAEKIVRAISAGKDYDMKKLPSKEQIFAVEKQLSNLDKHVSVVEKDVETFKGSFATKADLKEVETKLSNDIAAVEAKLSNTIAAVESKLEAKIGVEVANIKTEIANSKNETLKWCMATSITIIVVITGVLFKLLGH